MTIAHILKLAILTAALAAGSIAARADNTGFDSIHSQVRINGKTCFADHAHSGSGAGPNRKAAEAQAIKSWYDYTAGEYGSDWAHIGKAVKKSMTCSQNSSNWTCDVDATPCR